MRSLVVPFAWALQGSFSCWLPMFTFPWSCGEFGCFAQHASAQQLIPSGVLGGFRWMWFKLRGLGIREVEIPSRILSVVELPFFKKGGKRGGELLFLKGNVNVFWMLHVPPDLQGFVRSAFAKAPAWQRRVKLGPNSSTAARPFFQSSKKPA